MKRHFVYGAYLLRNQRQHLMEIVTFDEQDNHRDIRKACFIKGLPCNANLNVRTLSIVFIGWHLRPSRCHWCHYLPYINLSAKRS